VLRDGIQAPARVTDTGSRKTIYYTYAAGGKTFTGHGPREYRDPLQANVGVGRDTPVWYSASHPWLSSPRRPEMVLEAFPWIVLVTLFDLLLIALLIWTWQSPPATTLSRAKDARQ
jgi:hypothetical protein